VEHGTLKELHHECGYDASAIADTVREMMLKVNISSILQQ
jgi:1-deoxy-D-xylulose-5-phosphate synthase